MQPIQNFLFLAQPRKPVSIRPSFPGIMGHRSFSSFFIALAVICFFPATSNEEHVSGLDVAALSCGSDVDALIFAAVVEFLEGDGMVVVGVVGDSFFVGVASVVEEDAAAGNAVVSPVVNRAFVVGVRTSDVAAFCLRRSLVRIDVRRE